ncbi:MAG: hypothetical protein JF567_09565 [Xanthomonadales bacterium]|nr:hypothetical protein [Xanthomonadales bacterium]
MILFFAMLFLATAIAGFCAFVIFWPLSLVHLRDRHPGLRGHIGDFSFLNPKALSWLLLGHYREVRDRSFTGLATPARVALLVIIGGLLAAGLLWLVSAIFPALSRY